MSEFNKTKNPGVLDPAAILAGNEIIEIFQNSEGRRTSPAAILAYLASSGHSGDTEGIHKGNVVADDDNPIIDARSTPETSVIIALSVLASTFTGNLIGNVDGAIVDGDTLITKTLTPVNAVDATGTLTVDTDVVEGNTVTIGADVYEVDSDGSVTASNIPVDVSAISTYAQGKLTVAVRPTPGDIMTIGGTDYTFVTFGTEAVPGEISVGTDLATAKVDIEEALAGTDGINTANAEVSITTFATNDLVLTARISGVEGDLIATTSTFDSGSNLFDAVTLGTEDAGLDCIPAAFITALIATEVAGVGVVEDVTLAEADGDTMLCTAVLGVAGNLDTTDVLSGTSAWGAATLINGADGTLGSKGQIEWDNDYVYVCKVDNAVFGQNWIRAKIDTYIPGAVAQITSNVVGSVDGDVTGIHIDEVTAIVASADMGDTDFASAVITLDGTSACAMTNWTPSVGVTYTFLCVESTNDPSVALSSGFTFNIAGNTTITFAAPGESFIAKCVSATRLVIMSNADEGQLTG